VQPYKGPFQFFRDCKEPPPSSPLIGTFQSLPTPFTNTIDFTTSSLTLSPATGLIETFPLPLSTDLLADFVHFDGELFLVLLFFCDFSGGRQTLIQPFSTPYPTQASTPTYPSWPKPGRDLPPTLESRSPQQSSLFFSIVRFLSVVGVDVSRYSPFCRLPGEFLVLRSLLSLPFPLPTPLIQ